MNKKKQSITIYPIMKTKNIKKLTHKEIKIITNNINKKKSKNHFVIPKVKFNKEINYLLSNMNKSISLNSN